MRSRPADRESVSVRSVERERRRSALPGCTEHRGAAPCFLRHSGSSCRRRRTAGAPGAARCRSDRPEKHRFVSERRTHRERSDQSGGFVTWWISCHPFSSVIPVTMATRSVREKHLSREQQLLVDNSVYRCWRGPAAAARSSRGRRPPWRSGREE